MALRSAASAESRAESEANQAARWSASMSSASSRYGLSARQRSGLMGGMSAHSRWRRAADSMVQVEAAFFPVALDRPLRDAAHRGDLGEREAAEELQLDDFRQLRFDLGELVERVADHDERRRVHHAVGVIGAERGDVE